MTSSDPKPPRSSPRRAWVGFGEAVGALALLVAALGFWDSHQERVREDRDRAEADRRSARASVFLLRGEAAAGGAQLELQPVRADQVIQSQTFVFQAAVRQGPVSTTGEARIEAGWFADGARKAAHKAGGMRDGGDLRLPVWITTSYLEDGQVQTDQSIYWIGYRLEPHLLLLAPKIELEGLSVARRAVTGDPQVRLDALGR